MEESANPMPTQNSPKKEIAKPFVFRSDGMPYIAVPEKFRIEEVEQTLDRPVRDKRMVFLVDVDSFVRYLAIHKSDKAAIHVNVKWPDHGSALAMGYCDDGCFGATSWRDHKLLLSPVLTKDFKDWSEIDCVSLSQLDLVRFLDRHLSNIVVPDDMQGSPSASEVMSFVSNLSDVKKVEFKKSVNLDNGRVQLTYNEVDADGATAQITIPKEFWIQLRPIVGHPSEYRIRVSLRYRIEDTSRLIFTLELRDLQQLLEQLREEIVADLKEKAGDTPVFLTVD